MIFCFILLKLSSHVYVEAEGKKLTLLYLIQIYYWFYLLQLSIFSNCCTEQLHKIIDSFLFLLFQ